MSSHVISFLRVISGVVIGDFGGVVLYFSVLLGKKKQKKNQTMYFDILNQKNILYFPRDIFMICETNKISHIFRGIDTFTVLF